MTFDPRKWWHTKLRILDRDSIEKSTFTTIDPLSPASSATNRITAKTTICTDVDIPPAAFDSSESPGYFVYKPTLDDLGGISGLAYVVPSDYSSVLAINNRRIFEYELRYAYDSTDIDCTTSGPPDTHSPDIVATSRDEDHSILFLFDRLNYFDSIGCCNIHLSHPGEPIPPGSINECSRLWSITDISGTPSLYSWDFSADPGNEKIDRGEIISSGTGTIIFYDLAWDSDNRLWGLEQSGLRQLLIGSSTENAVAIHYAVVTDNFSGAAVATLFPITPASTGSPGMSYNQNNQKLYISANHYIFELNKISDSVWNIVRYQDLGSGGDLRDLAFDPFGKCFCIYNNNLSTILFDAGLGALTQVTNDGSFLHTTGLDFVVNLPGGQLVDLYAVDSNGQIYNVDRSSGSRSIISGASFGATVIGTSSCQAGEDTKINPFPFDPGNSPWIFMLNYSSSMTTSVPSSGLTKWQTVVDGMTIFLQNNTSLNDEMVIVTYGDTINTSPRFVFHTQSDIQDAINWIQSLTSPTGATNFCSSGPFNDIFLNPYLGIRSLIVIGDGAFADCPSLGQPFTDYVTEVIQTMIVNNNPDLVARAVGIYPDGNGQIALGIIGSVGGGGYTEWV